MNRETVILKIGYLNIIQVNDIVYWKPIILNVFHLQLNQLVMEQTALRLK
nr:MAG TPA: hypothetical protein [Caudoviricetes sp.]